MHKAVAAARRAFRSWSETTPQERSLLLLKLADASSRTPAAFAELESLNCGKPQRARARRRDPGDRRLLPLLRRRRALPARQRHRRVPAGHTSMIRRDPVGVVAQIAPWNYPLMMAAWKIAPALAAGNTVVLKPSEQTPLTTLLLAQVLRRDLSRRAWSTSSPAAAPRVGPPLVEHPERAHGVVTGDVGHRQQGAAGGAGTLKRTHLELGGKAPVIVFDDADLDAVVDGLRTFGYYNAGQDCTAACRIYAGAKIYDKLVADLRRAVKTHQVRRSPRTKTPRSAR